MTCWALIPFKGFDRGKSRLSGVLDSTERAEFARELFDHVLRVLRDCPSIDGVAVISNSQQAREHARALGVTVLEDLYGSVDYKAHLATVMVKRAVLQAVANA